MSTKKLWISTIAVLRRNLRLNPLFSADFNPKFESPRISSCFSYYKDESRGSGIYKDWFPINFKLPSKNFSSESIDRCWNCGTVAASTPFLSCESCRSVQRVDPSVNYFQIFGLEKGYEIQDDNLEGKYKDWQKKLHPDLVHSKSKTEREYAAEQSARVIDAYGTLRKPLLRAMYLLKLEGIHVDEEKTVSDPEFLAEIMEIREAVEESVNSQKLKKIQYQIQEKFRWWSASFGDAFKNRNYEDAVTSIQRMTYFERINEEIVKKL